MNKLQKRSSKHLTQSSVSGSEKRICQNLDCLLQTEQQRNSTYQKIEDLHHKLKSDSTDRRNVEKQIASEEIALDKIFTEFKSNQSALEMAIARCRVCLVEESTDIDTDTSSGASTPLTEDEFTSIITSRKDDFSVEDE